MSKNSLTISIVTANRPVEFKDALESVNKLNYKDFSVIIGDDSSNNKSQLIAKKVMRHAQYYRNNPILGEIKNTNTCISLASSEFVCLFHDDDQFDPAYFDVIVEKMKKNPDIDLSYTGRIMIDQNNRELARQVVDSDRDSYVYRAHDILDYMVFGKRLSQYKVFINTPGLVMRKKVFTDSGGFDPSIDTHCDTDFLLKVLLVSNRVLFINKPLYINKIWYGLSGRTKSSEKGTVFFAEKSVLDNFIKYSKVMNVKKYYKQKESIYKKFSLDSIAVNGPLSWISLRYKGLYINKLAVMCRTAYAIVKLNPTILLLPKFYLVFLINLMMPRFIRQSIHKLLLKYYLTKK